MTILPPCLAQAQWLGTPPLSGSAPAVPTGALATSATARTAKKSDLKITWATALKMGESQDELGNKSTYSALDVRLDFESDLTPFLNLKIVPEAFFRNGHTQSASSTNGRLQSFDVLEASANLHDKEWIQLSLGALNGADYFSSALVDGDMAFPAVRASLQTGSQKTSYAGVFAEAAVPTSATLTSNSGEVEKTPSFTAAGWRGQYQVSQWKIKSHGVYFQYQDLPQTVATDSALLGNTAESGNQSPVSDFKYQYRGYEVGGSVRWDATRRLGFETGALILQNQAAPSEMNQGYVTRAKMDLWNGSLKWTPWIEYYRMEPDVVVADYNSGDYQTNRVGVAGGLSVQYKKLFKVKAKGSERQILFESASQAHERLMSLTLETLDAPF